MSGWGIRDDRDDDKVEFNTPGVTWVLTREEVGRIVQILRVAVNKPTIVEGDVTVDYTDGEWIGATLGHFIGLLVDVGLDPAVMFRVVEDSEPDGDGKFIRRLEVIMLPNGYVVRELRSKGVDRVHKTLAALIEAGIVK